jgi:two-component system sensor histidine kinase KdpD
MSALLWDFFFEVPYYSFRNSGLEDQILFVTYVVVALVLGQLTARIRAQEKNERRQGERATALYLLNQELNEATELDGILAQAVRHLEGNFEAEAAVLLPDSSNPADLRRHPAGGLSINPEQLRVAARVFQHGRTAGKSAENMRRSEALFLPLQGGNSVLGVVALQPSRPFELPIHQETLLVDFLRQIALALDRLKMRKLMEESKLLAESERLSKTLLNSMSHEMRTPLAVIEVAAGNLIALQKSDASPSQREMIAEIREATERLNRLVGNVLDITRLDAGHIRPRLHFHDLSELINTAVAESGKRLARHQVAVKIDPELSFVRMDAALMHQAIINLLANAAFHTPAGTRVEVTAKTEGGTVAIQVADRGPGVDPACLELLFAKFYRAPAARAGGTGLGLSIVKGFVEAQGGQVMAENRVGGGMAFTIRLPLDQSPAVFAERDPLLS